MTARIIPLRSGFVDQAITVEEMNGGMIVIDPLLDEWIDDESEDCDCMRLAA